MIIGDGILGWLGQVLCQRLTSFVPVTPPSYTPALKFNDARNTQYLLTLPIF